MTFREQDSWQWKAVCEVHNLSHVFAYTSGTWSLYITQWLQSVNARAIFLCERKHGTKQARPSFVTVKSVMVILSAFLWCILSGQSVSLFKMEKRVHHASKVSSKSCPPGPMCWNFAVCLSSRQNVFVAKSPHSALEHSHVPPLWLLCNAQYIFPTGARAQQL